LGDEFGLTSIELGFLNERRQAFENLASRVDLEAVRGVVTTMIQTEKYGTPLASALRVLSAEFRNERMMRAEEKAARLPAIMTVPLILFILPTLFIVILGPAACSISDILLEDVGGALVAGEQVGALRAFRRSLQRADAGEQADEIVLAAEREEGAQRIQLVRQTHRHRHRAVGTSSPCPTGL
jgi:Flp pilus assembly protein TadB